MALRERFLTAPSLRRQLSSFLPTLQNNLAVVKDGLSRPEAKWRRRTAEALAYLALLGSSEIVHRATLPSEEFRPTGAHHVHDGGVKVGIPQGTVFERVEPDPIEVLKAQRSPDGKRDDKHEARIAIDIINSIDLSPEGYNELKKNINSTQYAGALDILGAIPLVNGRPLKVPSPRFFVNHHTADPMTEGVESLIQYYKTLATDNEKDNELSVQWFIDRNGAVYLLASHPLNMAFHAQGFNLESTGVEVETYPGNLQGDISAKQYETLAYLNVYVVTEIYGVSPALALRHMVGHREINDLFKRGKTGKPDFNKEIMDVYRAKIGELIQKLQSSQTQIPSIKQP